LITKLQDMRVDVRTNLFGGTGDFYLTHFLEKEHSADTGRLFAHSKLPPGCSIGYHTHTGEFEVYYILSGKALVNDNGQEHILESGDSILTPSGYSHSIANVGEGDLEYIAFIIFDKATA